MNKSLKNFLTIITPLVIGIVMIYFQYQSLTKEELKNIIFYFKKADYFYIFLSLIIMLLAHYVRAYRWQYALDYLGYPTSNTNKFLAVVASYFMNLTIPRSGEVSRAALLYKYEDVPFDKSFGTIVTERIVDFIIFLLFVIFGLSLNFNKISQLLFDKINYSKVLIFTFSGLIILFVFIYIWKHTNFKLVILIKEKLKGLIEGMRAVLKMKGRKQFIFYSFFIWMLYFLMFYVVFLALDDSQNIPISTVIMGFIFGSLAIGLTNGGIGAYPLAVALVLSLFLVDKEVGVAIGWLAWTSQTIFTVFIGILSFLLFPLLNKK